MLESLPYAVALVAVAGIAWDAWRRHLAVRTSQLSVQIEFEEMKRDYELLKVQTKKAIESQHASLNDALATMNARINVEEMKRDNAFSRRIG